MKKEVIAILGMEKTLDTISKFTDDDYSQASAVTGIDKAEMIRVIGELAK